MIRTRGLQYRYAGASGLAFPDVDVPQGGTLLLRGRSGTGKSTWLALVAGLLAPTAGECVVADQPLAGLAGAARDAWRGRTIGFLPQRLHLTDALSVQDNLALAPFAAGVAPDAARARALLDRLGIGALAARRPSQLSVGQAQRVALARALLLRPRVVLADEPTASLDDESAAAAMDLLATCASELGATLVVATHDARAAAALPQAQTLVLGAHAEAAA